MANCANVWDADTWNIFVCMYESGHSEEHGECIESGTDAWPTVLALWSDSPESPVWTDVTYSSETITYCTDSALKIDLPVPNA